MSDADKKPKVLAYGLPRHFAVDTEVVAKSDYDAQAAEIERLKAENQSLKLATSIFQTSAQKAISEMEAHDFSLKIDKQAWIDMQAKYQTEIESLRSENEKLKRLSDGLSWQYEELCRRHEASESKREKLNGFWTEIRKAWISGAISDDSIKSIVNSFDQALAGDEGG